MEIGMIVSGLTTPGAFVSSGLIIPTNLSTLWPQSPALMGQAVSSDGFSTYSAKGFFNEKLSLNFL